MTTTPRSMHLNKLPIMASTTAHPRVEATTATPVDEGTCSSRGPDSPSARSYGGGDGPIGPMGNISAYTELDRPSRINSPIDLTHEVDNYTFPKHRLKVEMQGQPLLVLSLQWIGLNGAM